MMRSLALSLAGLLLLSACGSQSVRRPTSPAAPRQVQIPPPRVTVVETAPAPAPDEPVRAPPVAAEERDGPPDPRDIPADLISIAEPKPQDEPKSRSGNSKSYQVFGKTYHVLDSFEGFRETGLASWYGKKFHGRKTSSGDKYDMFKLTAAHKNLPIPCYARVTNLGNGKSVIVRINDRGPFHANRIIDLSYAAAAKLEMIGKIGMVEVEAISPGRELPPPPKLKLQTVGPADDAGAAASGGTRTGQRMLQVAAYSDPVNAVAMREELAQVGFEPALIRVGLLDNGDTVHRVMLGPFDERQLMDQMRIRVRGAGYEAIPVVE